MARDIVTSDTEVYAAWIEESVTSSGKIAVFERNGGDEDADPKFIFSDSSGVIASLPSRLPAKTGYSFDGWWTSETGGLEFSAGDRIYNSPTFLYAHWTATSSVTVTFEWNNASISAVDPIYSTRTVVRGEASGLPANPIDSSGNYRFRGWYLENGALDEQVTFYSGSEAVMDNKTVYARWDAEAVTGETVIVQFNNNGGDTNAVPSQSTAKIGEPVKLFPGILPTKAGHYFVGWDYYETGTEAFNPSRNVTDTPNPLILYAKYMPSTAKIVIFSSYLAEILPSPTYKTIGSNGKIDAMPSEPERRGYAFDGWYTGETSGVNAFPDGTDTIFTDTIIVYPHWTEDSTQYVTVTFNKNTSDPTATEASPRTIQVLTGSYLTGFPNPPECEGYVFKGWYDNPGGTGSKYSVPLLITADTTFSAKWEEATTSNSWTVNYINAEGSTTPNPTLFSTDNVATYIVTLRSNGSAGVYAGHYFAGWKTAGGILYSGGTEVSASTLGLSASVRTITLTGEWRELLSITFEVNHSDGSDWTPAIPDSIDVDPVTQKIPELPLDPTRSGYVFSGWFNDDACTDAFIRNTVITSNKPVYAKWTLSTSDIWRVRYFVDNGGANSAADDTMSDSPSVLFSIRSQIKSSVTVPADKRFAGWSKTSGSSIVEYAGGTEVLGADLGFTDATKEVKLYVVWENAIVYTVTFRFNDGTTHSTTRTTNALYKVEHLPILRRNGFLFDHWNEESNDSGSNITTDTVMDSDTTVYAIWSRSAEDDPDAAGGAVSQVIDGGVEYEVHTFKSADANGTLMTFYRNPTLFQFLAIAGGGGGGGGTADLGNSAGGGGGAGGYQKGTFTTKPKTVYVGKGGAGGASGASNGVNGSDSKIIGVDNNPVVIAIGGGGGGGRDTYYDNGDGSSGGSGGGSVFSAGGASTSGTGGTFKGNKGGTSGGIYPYGDYAGSGGGIGSPGKDECSSWISDPDDDQGPGAGILDDIGGSATFYGLGGIVAGPLDSPNKESALATRVENTGNGGIGGYGTSGYAGMSGIVIIRWVYIGPAAYETY
jgi:uncharacterized repeat protein (TIGR02543 family)